MRIPIGIFGAIALAVSFVCGGCNTGAAAADRAGGVVQQRFPNAGQSHYQRTYDDYRRDHSKRSLVAPALGYEPPSRAGQIATNVIDGTEAKLAEIGSAVKSRLKHAGRLLSFDEPVAEASDPTSLSSEAKPSPGLYFATARLSEQSGNPKKAEEYYRRALQLDSRHYESLFGLARLLDRQGRLKEATEYYRRAAQVRPNSPGVFNDLGICFARRQMPAESLGALRQAIALSPSSPLYRHNIATVLVQMGESDAALEQLRAVHDEATAHYNLGYLLQKKGDRQTATAHFAQALRVRPNFAEARAWLDALGGAPPSPASVGSGDEPAEEPQRVASRRESAGRPQFSLPKVKPFWSLFEKESDAEDEEGASRATSSSPAPQAQGRTSSQPSPDRAQRGPAAEARRSIPAAPLPPSGSARTSYGVAPLPSAAPSRPAARSSGVSDRAAPLPPSETDDAGRAVRRSGAGATGVYPLPPVE